MQILSFKKDGKYVLQKGRTEDNNPELTEQSIKYEAKRREALALINSGFWSYEGLDRPFAQKEIELGKTGLLYGDDQNKYHCRTIQISTQLKYLPTWEATVGIQVPLVFSLKIKSR